MAKMVSTSWLEEGICELKMDDAEGQNRLSDQLCLALMEALDRLANEAALKVLMLRGGPEVFCAGATREALQRISAGELKVKDVQLPAQLLAFPLPVIGVLEGHAVGGGFTLALCCDLRVAADNRRYGVNFTSMGFTPAMGTTALLPCLAGHALASEMMLTARFYRGRELAGRGLSNEVVPAAQVFPRALDLARRMVDKERGVLEMVKETLALERRMALQAAMSREHLMHRICFSQPQTRALSEENYLDGSWRL